jgi:hypothetical protein
VVGWLKTESNDVIFLAVLDLRILSLLLKYLAVPLFHLINRAGLKYLALSESNIP